MMRQVYHDTFFKTAKNPNKKLGVRDLTWWPWMLGSVCVLGRHALVVFQPI